MRSRPRVSAPTCVTSYRSMLGRAARAGPHGSGRFPKEARMSRTSKITLTLTVAVCVAIAGLLALPYRSYAQAPAKRGVVLDNARVTVQRVTQPAGTIEKPHPHP